MSFQSIFLQKQTNKLYKGYSSFPLRCWYPYIYLPGENQYADPISLLSGLLHESYKMQVCFASIAFAYK